MELARIVGTPQSAISRLEDADYKGHSLTMPGRIALALDQKLSASLTAKLRSAQQKTPPDRGVLVRPTGIEPARLVDTRT